MDLFSPRYKPVNRITNIKGASNQIAKTGINSDLFNACLNGARLRLTAFEQQQGKSASL